MTGSPGPRARDRRAELDRSPVPRLHVVTDDRVLSDREFEARARALLEAGGPRLGLHLRGHGTTGRRLHHLATALLPAARKCGALLLVNDRVDVALVAGLDGVQLGERSLPPGEARALLPRSVLVGASVHDVEGATRISHEGADFLLVGTIFATPSHPGRPGAGPALVSGVARRVPTPVVAIGGVTPVRVREVRRAGALGVAVLSGVWGEDDPAGAARRYLEAFEDEDPA